MDIQNLIPPIAQWLGIDPTTALLLLGLLVAACNVISKVIPDSATGALGLIRKLASVIGLQISNKIEPGVSIKDISKAAMGLKTVSNEVRKDDNT